MAASAFAASPNPGALYKGVGKNFMNNAPKWANEGTAKISFKTSADGSKVINFKGSYAYYCGAGTSTVTEKHIPISKRGTFSLKFSQPIKGPNGKINSTAYAAISGTFGKGGKQANVSYLIDYVFTGKTVKHPYSTSNPRALGCASWVRGTVKTK